MVKIGNIVTFGSNLIELDHFNFFRDLNSLGVANNDLPTLYVGYASTTNHFGYLNFFNKQLTNNSFWTLNKEEDRYNYIKDLSSFIDFCEAKLTNGFEYFFVNPFELTKPQTKRFIKFLKNNTGFYVNDNQMVYVTVKGKTYGIHSEFTQIVGIPKDRVLKFLSDNGYGEISNDVLNTIKEQLSDLEYELSELLFLKEKFAI